MVIGQFQVLARDHWPPEAGCQPRSFCSHVGCQLGPREDPPEGERHGVRVIVVDHDAGSLESNSTACGKAVATTGRPAAIGSTRTPDVTWSFES